MNHNDIDAPGSHCWIVRQGDFYYLAMLGKSIVLSDNRGLAERFVDREFARLLAKCLSRRKKDVRVCRVRTRFFGAPTVMWESLSKVSL